MRSNPDDFAESIERDLAEAEQRYTSNASLRVAVVGPNLGNADDPGSVKRQQIYDAIKSNGHDPFFPEEHVNSNYNLPLLDQERLILNRDDVDLVIVLDCSGVALAEISNFASFPEIVIKTGVLFPLEFDIRDSLPRNVIASYSHQWKYTQEDLEACHVVEVCLDWVRNRLLGAWSIMVSHKD